jgi:DNA-binding XRE family transcriptional regulator
MLKSPTPDQLKSTRKALGYTQKEAAELVHVSLRAWQLWEAGDRKMPPGIWELCVIKAGLHPLYRAHKGNCGQMIAAPIDCIEPLSVY